MNVAVPDLKWCFLFDPPYSWFESFVNDFCSPDISFIKDYEDYRPPTYVFSSPHLTELADKAAVRDRAAALKSILDGAFYLQWGIDFRPFRLGELCDLTSGRRHGYGAVQPDGTSYPFSPASVEWIGQWRSHESPFSYFTSSVLWLAREDEQSRGMLQFLGINGCTWISLYALLDFMRAGGMSNNDVAKSTNSNESEVKRFTHTANNFAAIGPLCRHGERGHKPPNVPMRLDEASGLLLPAAKTFLLSRIKSLALQKKWEVQHQ